MTDATVAGPGHAMPHRFDPDRTLIDYVAETARRTPQAPALLLQDETVDYSALMARADAVARALIAAGVAPGAAVGLAFTRSAGSVIALLGALRAGACAVPLDPAYSDATQMAQIVAQVPFAALLQAKPGPLPEGCAGLGAVPRLALCDLDDRGRTEPVSPWPSRTGEDAACMVFTSGTTGVPKGVVLPHRGLAAFTLDQPVIGLGAQDVMLHASSLACDGGLIEVWSALMAGAALAVVEAPRPALAEVAATMTRHKVTATSQYVGMHNLLVAHHVEAFASVRLAMAGGDVLSPEPLRRLKRAVPGLRMVNIYGPSETTCISLVQEIGDDLLDGAPIPIGRPLAHESACVVDEDLAPVPDGTVGELLIGGAGVALGYFGMAERTAAVFIDDPRPGRSGRVYRTGDLALRRPDGTFEFFGRADRQIKLGGRRIELDGIEHVFRDLPGVRAAVAEAIAGPGGDRRIGLAVEPETAPDDEAAFVRALLAAAAGRLHAEFLPRHVLLVSELPLTRIGKPDRKALRARIEASIAPARPAAGVAETEAAAAPGLAAPSEAPEPEAAAPALAGLPGARDPAATAGPAAAPAAAGDASLRATPRATAAAPAIAAAAVPAASPSAAQIARMRAAVAGLWDAMLGCGPLSDDATFFDAGGTSLQLIDAHARLQAELGVAFDLTLFFETPRLGAIARALAALAPAEPGPAAAADTVPPVPKTTPEDGERDIAIIGYAARVPGAPDLDAFWQAQRAGANLIRRFSPGELEDDEARRADPNYVPARSVLDDVEMFDAKYFGILPREAERMDPQARLFLELCVEALDAAALDPARAPGAVGVYAGCSTSTYLLHHLMADRARLTEFTTGFQIDNYTTLTGNITDTLSSRVAYKLDLKGPAMTVHTACSTSLTAIAQAVGALRAGQCAVALAGGISVTFPQRRGYVAQEGGMSSPDGLCRPFDAQAGGTVFGHGGGVLVLKPLARALADGDRIEGVIRGVGLGNDGADKISFTAPSVAGQADAIRAAHRDAGIDAGAVQFVECHGTATPLGDPIEIRALAQVFEGVAGEIALGSVKGSIGHLDSGAGVVGVIRTLQAMKAREIPPMAQFTAPNPRIDFAATPFRVPTAPRPWKAHGPRMAGVSSFGIGGTNAHVVLQEAPPVEAAAPADADPVQVLPLSAKSPEALAQMARALADRLDGPQPPALPDVALTLQDGRRMHDHRLAVAAATPAEAAARLRAAPAVRVAATGRPVAMLFPGQGAQYPGMGAGLYRDLPDYARLVDEGCEILDPLLDRPLKPLLTDAAPAGGAAEALRQTALAQPALVLTQIALARVWMARGVRPTVLLGHSIGEFAAAAIAGILDTEDALALAARRGALMQARPEGAMLSVRASEAELRAHLVPGIDIAAANAPKLQVAAGPHEAIRALAAALDAAGILHRRLNTSHAFHSAMMEPVTAPLAAAFAERPLRSPQIAMISAMTGRPLRGTEATDPAFWAAQARNPVRFAQALQSAVAGTAPALLEIGPGKALSTFAAQGLDRAAYAGAVQSLPDHDRAQDDFDAFAGAIGGLWSMGAEIDLARATRRGSRKLALPGTVFLRRRHWIDAVAPALGDNPTGQAGAGPDDAPVPAPQQPPEAGRAAAARSAEGAARAAAPGSRPEAGPPTLPQIASQAVAVVPAPAQTPANEALMPQTPAAAPRRDRLVSELSALLSDLSGEEIGTEEAEISFLELGFDSLFLGQASQAIGRDYGVELSFRRLLSEFPTVAAVAAHLDATLPPEAAPAASGASAPADAGGLPAPLVAAAEPAPAAEHLRVEPAAAAPAPRADAGQPAGMPLAPQAAMRLAPQHAGMARPDIGGDLSGVLQAQMLTMQSIFAEQLRLLGAQPAQAARIDLPEAAQPAPAAAHAALPAPAGPAGPAAHPAPSAPAQAPRQAAADRLSPAQPQPEETGEAAPQPLRFGRAPALAHAELTDAQRAFAADLAARYGARFAGSKRHTDENRPHHADPRTVAGFRADWKELVFPVVAARAQGAYIEDVDGNRLVDVVNGFGTTAFGHSPEFVTRAVAEQMARGYPIGPQADAAGPLAARFARFVGHDRVTFCNTGSEAVMAAMRLARAVTGRQTIVSFTNDYHGQFDEVLVKARLRGAPGALPLAPGIPREAVANMVVLPWGSPEALDWIAANGAGIAAVVVEPVQSRHPETRPQEFVRAIRTLTREAGAAMVMDEVVTGFRTHARGIQGLWGIEADMATYGKVVGGGMPVGVLAGRRRFMDALDGGAWAFGDDSAPQVAPTFFAGTFVRHPLVLAAVGAVLDHLEREGDTLWTDTAERAQALARDMNAALVARGLPEFVTGFSSWFVINASQHDPRATLLYPLMRMEGVHILDGFCGFLTTAHGAEECARVLGAFETALDALQPVGILAPEPGRAQALPPVPAVAAAQTPAPEPEPLDGPVPLTESQREIWMSSQLGDLQASAFNESVSVRIEGPVDAAAMARALTALVARHDALRARFARDGSHFTVLPAAPVTPDFEDLSHGDADALLRDRLAADARVPVDITSGLPFRAMLFRLAEARHVLVMTAHHIVCDGWSYNTLLTELAALYTAETEGRAAGLAPAPSFAAFARSREGRETDPATRAYWSAQYADIPPLPELPTDRPRGARRSHAGATHTAHLPADLVKRLRKAGAKQGATLFATLFAGLQIMLGRLSGSERIVLGVPTGGQALLEDASMVGHLVNFLPIRADFDRSDSVAAHLARVRDAVGDGFAHGDYTLGTLVQDLAIPRTLSRLPITEVQFNLERVPTDLQFGAARAEISANPKAAVNFDLFFNMVEGRDGLRVDIDYNTALYDAETVDRWVDHLHSVLDRMAEAPDAAIADIALLSPAAERALAERWNRSALPYDRDLLVQDLVLAGVRAAGDAPALVGRGRTMSHAALADAVDALAAHVQARVPGHGARIAVAMPRGPEMVVALLAVLKAGHAYVPVDPDLPPARQRLLLDAARVAAILAPRGADAGSGAGAPVIHPEDASAGAVPAPRPVAATDPAYVIFTSGSTGTPKGVAIPHRAVVNFLTSMAQAPGLWPTDKLLAVTTVSFDIAVLELFLPLVVGAQVEIATRAEVVDGFALARRLAEGDITVMQATPTLWSLLLEAGFEPRSDLRMLAGGEALPEDLAARLTAGGATLWNLYGPTETTIWSALARVPAGGPVTIGAPVANTELHVLDETGRLCPPGVAGELAIGGDGLALGYFDRDDLTAAAFREHDLAGRRLRLYHTGDLAVRSADGTLRVLGRRDGQIKLRGFRIELGEIETRMRAQPGVVGAAVALHESPSGEKRLVGYIHGTAEARAVAAALARDLPDYMVPTAWTTLDALPQTANGKLDRKALPAPDFTAARLTAGKIEPPQTETEKALAAIWCEVLGLEAISVTDTVFAMGIDSLAVFRLAARMMANGHRLEARHVLDNPSLRQLATFADSRKDADLPAKPSMKDFMRRRAAS